MTKIYILERNKVPFYVGKTLQEIKERFHTHGIKKENSEIIEIDCVDDEEWRFWESWYIELFKSWGFELENKNSGGGGRGPGWISLPERGIKISKTLKEKNHSQYYTNEVRQKMSTPQKGRLKPFTEEHKKNISKANLESKGKVVECYSLDGKFIEKFNCLREAKVWITEKKLIYSPNIDKQIKDCCNGRQKTCHGYKFKYK
jgi:hypothetical protein